MRLTRQIRPTSTIHHPPSNTQGVGAMRNTGGSMLDVGCWMFGSRKGVALVVTLILLAVITFMAVTFLVLTRSEHSAVNVTKAQTTATLAADVAFERVKGDMLARIFASGSANNIGLFVSTNY